MGAVTQVRLICASCQTPLLLLEQAEDGTLEIARRLDRRLFGSAVQFQLVEGDDEEVHKVLVWCQAKRCRGNPQVTTANLRRLFDMLGVGRDTPYDLAL